MAMLEAVVQKASEVEPVVVHAVVQLVAELLMPGAGLELMLTVAVLGLPLPMTEAGLELAVAVLGLLRDTIGMFEAS